MKIDEVHEWIQALRSGEFRQGANYLHKKSEYCCLGVKCELDVRAQRHDMRTAFAVDSVMYGIVGSAMSNEMPTEDIRNKWGMSIGLANKLAQMNDGGFDWTALSFSQIADFLQTEIDNHANWIDFSENIVLAEN